MELSEVDLKIKKPHSEKNVLRVSSEKKQIIEKLSAETNRSQKELTEIAIDLLMENYERQKAREMATRSSN